MTSTDLKPRQIPRWSGWAVAIVVFATMAPTLGWLEFSNGIEGLHAATVLELRRDGGSWVMPTLNGTLRIKKPPLPAWIGGLAVTDATVAGASSPDRGQRDRAFSRLAWEIRYPALLAGCLMLVATFDLAKTLAGRGRRRGGLRVALAATVIAATSLLFLRFMRLASTDVHLALWVTVTNALLARAVLRRQRWCLVGVGWAVGLAFLCKGPVAILQTLIPVLVACTYAHLRRARIRRTSRQELAHEHSPGAQASRVGFVPVLMATAAFLAVALPWPIMVLRSHDGALATWWKEITRKDATDLEPGPFYSYLSLLVNILPWLPAFLVGVGLSFIRRKESAAGRTLLALRPSLTLDRHRGYLLAFLWLVVPILVMSCFKDKAERYMLPLIPAAAILSARGLLAIFSGMRRKNPIAGMLFASQCAVVAGAAIGLPAVGMIAGRRLPAWVPSWIVATIPQRIDGSAWYSPWLGLTAVAAGVITTVVLFRLMRRPGGAKFAVAVAAFTLLAGNALLLWGYKDSPDGRAEMRPIAERILSHVPNATVAYFTPDKPMPPDLSIYLNRVVRPRDAKRSSSEPDVLVSLQRENTPKPTVDGWRVFASEHYKKRFWHALERLPAMNQAGPEDAFIIGGPSSNGDRQ